MKKLICFLVCLCFCFFSEAKYPQLISWQNSPNIQLANHKKLNLKKNETINSSFAVVTSTNDRVEILFTDGEVMRIQPDSRVQVSHVSNSESTPEIFILDGQIQLQSESVKSRSKIRIKSAFFDLELPIKLNMVLTMDSKKPSTTFEVIQGEITATFFDFEKTQILKSGEAVTFVGENDNYGHVKYDILLNDKKAPHGILQEKVSFNGADYIQKEKESLARQKIEQEKKRRADALAIEKKKKLVDSFLCHGPDGKLDQCYWKKSDSLCFRYRCNAEGRWDDKTERPMNQQCGVAVQAERCDY